MLSIGTGLSRWQPDTGVPAIYNWREAVVAGGLMSYAPSITDAYRKPASMPAAFSRAKKPAELPVQLPTKFELVINLKTARRAYPNSR